MYIPYTASAVWWQLTGEVAGLRVGLLKEGFDGAEPEVTQTVREAAESLKTLGISVEEFSFPTHNDGISHASHLSKLTSVARDILY